MSKFGERLNSSSKLTKTIGESMSLELTPQKNINIEDLIPHEKEDYFFSTRDIPALAEAIKNSGHIEPLQVAQLSEGKYQILAGHSRYYAAKSLGKEKLPCIVLTQPLTEDNKLEYLLSSNIHRENDAITISKMIEGYEKINLAKGLKTNQSNETIMKMLRLKESSFYRLKNLSKINDELLIFMRDNNKLYESWRIMTDLKIYEKSEEKQIEILGAIKKYIEDNGISSDDEISYNDFKNIIESLLNKEPSPSVKKEEKKEKSKYADAEIIKLSKKCEKIISNNCEFENLSNVMSVIDEIIEQLSDYRDSLLN